MSQTTKLDLFAGIPVADYAAALRWYERLLGSPPTFFPHDTEAVWELAEHPWATSCPEKRRTLAQLGVSDAITLESHQAARHALADIAQLLDRSRAHGPMRDVPLGFVVALMSALADATIDYMLQDPANADTHCRAAFDAFWRMVA